MPVDLIALYLKIYTQCLQSPDGIYECDTNRFYQDTGFTTFNVLTPLMRNGSIEVKAVGKECPDELYHITVKEELR
ncbi:MAG TPA: hypothetical protein VEP90_13140 [Methylomirabilota bacterium]|nr:hypothetical protein [Methylomirabilota bacterium]